MSVPSGLMSQLIAVDKLCPDGRKAQRAFGQAFCVPQWVPSLPFSWVMDLDPKWLLAGGVLLVFLLKRSTHK